MSKFRRLLRHLCTTTGSGRRLFPDQALERIQNLIQSGEAMHRAEIRLIIEPALTLADVLAGETSRERASELFCEYRVWDTEDNCGILIYLNLADHKVEIMADRGIAKKIQAEEWQAVCQTMTRDFAAGRRNDSILAALEQLNQLLAQRAPASGPRTNQLPDQPLIL